MRPGVLEDSQQVTFVHVFGKYQQGEIPTAAIESLKSDIYTDITPLEAITDNDQKNGMNRQKCDH